MPKPNDKPTPPKRLAKIAARAAADDFGGFHGEPADTAPSFDVSTLLAMALLQDAMRRPDLERIKGRAGLAVVVSVPGPDWVEPVARALRRAGDWGELAKRNGSARMQDRPDVGCDSVADTLASGLNVVGVSNAPERYLPANLVALADIRVDLKAPSPRVLRSVVRLVTGTRPGPIPLGAGGGLPFATLVG